MREHAFKVTVYNDCKTYSAFDYPIKVEDVPSLKRKPRHFEANLIVQTSMRKETSNVLWAKV